MEQNVAAAGGVSTELTLLYNHYKIKKKLRKSDVGPWSRAWRLLISKLGVESHLLPCMSEELVQRVNTTEGAEVVVWDADTRSEHRLVFALWDSYVLKGSWIEEFVRRRGLSEGDEVGICGDPFDGRFLFSLLSRASVSRN